MKPNIWLMTFLLILILFIIGMTLAYFIVTNNEREVESASDFAKFMTIILICQRKVVV